MQNQISFIFAGFYSKLKRIVWANPRKFQIHDAAD